jgi:hypothetical protein
MLETHPRLSDIIVTPDLLQHFTANAAGKKPTDC